MPAPTRPPASFSSPASAPGAVVDWTIDDDLRRASTLPSKVYRDPALFALARERVFAPSWQMVGWADDLRVPGQVRPVRFLDDILPEPLLLVRDRDDELRCLSNVCTHRGALVCEAPGVETALRCRYHGRRFGLDGRFLSMPEFDGVEGFPTPADDLARLPFGRWGKLLFAALDPAEPLAAITGELDRRLGWLPLDQAVFDPGRSRDYLVAANWALYCDNYLEGFHIPFVHAALAEAVDYGTYTTELLGPVVLQTAGAKGGDDVFTPPPGHPDHGRRVAAWYFFCFPNLMLNAYPWGISINRVQPLAVDRTRVSFLTYVWDPARLGQGAGTGLDRVEREDEAVVESVQRGVGSRIYRRGRYSPAREAGVHHFHRLLSRALAG